LIFLFLVGVNLIGWTALSEQVGQTIVAYADVAVKPVISVIVGALLVTGVLGILWALGIGFFQFLAMFILLMISSLGVGAVLLPWVSKRLGGAQVQDPDPVSDVEVVCETEEAVSEPSDPGETAAVTQMDESAEPDDGDLMPIGEDSEDSAKPIDDFTQLRGIGPQYAQRLEDAGVRSFAQLAAMASEEIGEILGWTPERVLSSGLIEEAKILSGEA
jgi:predicted flap endonuclease-1-like 5' DNA nuclease